jgi:cell division septation protein DedD
MSRVTRRRSAALCALAAALLCLPAADAAAARAAKRDRAKPVVKFRAPTVGAKVSGALSGGRCKAWARDRFRVARVKFYVDGRVLEVDRAAPYTCAWDTTRARVGRHRLTARAVDRSGNAASTTVAVRVVRSKPTPKPRTTSPPTPSPTPTPSPAPAPTPTPTPTPLPTGFPDASNTGVPAGTTLTAYTGPSTISTPGAVIDSKAMGCIRVTVPGVIIRRSKISCANDYAVYSGDGDYSGAPVLIEDSEIDCESTGGTALGEANVTARRLNIHGCENGGDINQTFDVQDSYIHDLFQSASAHPDGFQFASGHFENGVLKSGSRDVTIRHNTIYATRDDGTIGNASIISNRGGDRNILIQGNLFAGGGYTIYCEQGATGSNYRVLDNAFSRRFSLKVGFYGPSTDCSDETQSGNYIYETGEPLMLP